MSSGVKTALSYLGRALVVAVVAGGLLWTATHGVAGVAWGAVVQVLAGVTPGNLVVLAVVWVAGLLVYSTVLARALPGLGMRRGLLLNLTGSAVSNVMPLGGAAGSALNWRMLRTWGHSHQAFARFFVVTNALDVLTKLVLPPVAVVALLALSVHVPMTVWAVVAVCVVALLLAAGVQAWARRLAPAEDPADDAATASRLARLRTEAVEVVAGVREVMARDWQWLVPASFAYLAAQVLLLSLSLHAVGLAAPLALVVMAAAIERVASLAPITPAGTGFAELGAVTWLVFNGLDPVAVVAGVLLYRVFLVALEIPVGGLLLTGWAAWRRTTRARGLATGRTPAAVA